MKINQDKFNRQLEGIEKYKYSSQFGAKKDRSGTFHWFTGVGKTFAALTLIERLGYSKVSVVVPTIPLFEQWRTVIKVLKPHLEGIIGVYTAAYIVENKDKMKEVFDCELLIADELHMFYGTEYIKTIDGTYISFKDNLGLTATYYDMQGREKELQHLYPIIDEIDEATALDKGFISKYIEYNLHCPLNEDEKEAYDKFTAIINANLPKFGKHKPLKLATLCLTGGMGTDGVPRKAMTWCAMWARKNGYHPDSRDDVWNPYKIMGYAKKLMDAIQRRKELLYTCASKVDYTLRIVDKFPKSKTIIFGESTEFADKVDLLLNETTYGISVVYHSKLPTVMMPSPKTGKPIKFGQKKLRDRAIERIKTGMSRVICTASALDVGFDVEDMNLGIIASGNSNPNKRQQRGGRVKRVNTQSMFPDKELVLLINLYVKDTKDEDWLRKSQKTKNPIWIDSIDELYYDPTGKKAFNIKDL